jgi:hypothetical protein
MCYPFWPLAPGSPIYGKGSDKMQGLRAFCSGFLNFALERRFILDHTITCKKEKAIVPCASRLSPIQVDKLVSVEQNLGLLFACSPP